MSNYNKFVNYKGNLKKKPWEYNVTVVIPTRDTPEQLDTCLEILQLQTEVPYIIIVNTGEDTIEPKADNIEVHTIRGRGWQHLSEPVCAALDLSLTICRTKFWLSIHSDVFLQRQEVISELLELTKVHKVVGWRNVPRYYPGWEFEVGHALLMCDIQILRANNINWSIRQFAAGQELGHTVFGPSSPDTESNFNYTLQAAKIRPYMLGTEKNRARNVNSYFDHPRGYTSALFYSPAQLEKVNLHMQEALKDAKIRINTWKNTL
ncbi:MAG: hypothetical protein KGI50_06555 [Patescibacteria group bacterium]|nr:hypothetical protein [Patescibacteria group bacterium]